MCSAPKSSGVSHSTEVAPWLTSQSETSPIERIGAKAARGVGAAAVGTEDELGDVSGLTDAPVRLGDHLACKARALLDCLMEPPTFWMTRVSTGLLVRSRIASTTMSFWQPLAAQGDANDAIDVRVRSVACQGSNSHLLVAVDLRTAILVVEGDAALNRVRDHSPWCRRHRCSWEGSGRGCRMPTRPSGRR